jgi:ATP-dependent Clp protease adapter protein ClpS
VDKTARLIARIVGGISIAFGIASAVLAVWAIGRQFAVGRVVWISAAVVVLFFLTIAVFCCLVGYRLLFNRPTRDGLLLSRNGWRMVSLGFCTIALTFVAIMLGWHSPGAGLAAVILGALAAGSVVAAGVVHRKAAYSPVLAPGTSLLQLEEFVPAGFAIGIELMNDDLTPMVFVVAVLQSALGLSETDAIQTMLQIHGKGGALLPTPSFEEATRIAALITEKARADGHPLVCRAVRIE